MKNDHELLKGSFYRITIDYERKIEELSAQVVELKRRLADTATPDDAAIATLKRTLEELTKDNDALEDEIKDLEQTCKTLGTENDHLTKEIKRLTASTGEDDARSKARTKSYHSWTTEEDKWIAAHINSATNVEIAERFGVTPKAASLRMKYVKDNLYGGKDDDVIDKTA